MKLEDAGAAGDNRGSMGEFPWSRELCNDGLEMVLPICDALDVLTARFLRLRGFLITGLARFKVSPFCSPPVRIARESEG